MIKRIAIVLILVYLFSCKEEKKYVLEFNDSLIQDSLVGAYDVRRHYLCKNNDDSIFMEFFKKDIVLELFENGTFQQSQALEGVSFKGEWYADSKNRNLFLVRPNADTFVVIVLTDIKSYNIDYFDGDSINITYSRDPTFTAFPNSICTENYSGRRKE